MTDTSAAPSAEDTKTHTALSSPEIPRAALGFSRGLHLRSRLGFPRAGCPNQRFSRRKGTVASTTTIVQIPNPITSASTSVRDQRPAMIAL